MFCISDRRIKNLPAQTNTQKLKLDNHIKDLIKQADRHQEDSEILVDRALQLKRNVQKGDEIEQSLLSNFSNLTLLLEMLNLEGDDVQKAEGTKMSNRVTIEIDKYRGKKENFST